MEVSSVPTEPLRILQDGKRVVFQAICAQPPIKKFGSSPAIVPNPVSSSCVMGNQRSQPGTALPWEQTACQPKMDRPVVARPSARINGWTQRRTAALGGSSLPRSSSNVSDALSFGLLRPSPPNSPSLAQNPAYFRIFRPSSLVSRLNGQRADRLFSYSGKRASNGSMRSVATP